ncbi:MAG: inositol monophosphatase family protein [bacterium]
MSISDRDLFAIIEIVKEAGFLAKKMFDGTEVDKKFKSERDIVTEADEKVEQMLINRLGAIDKVPFLSEEFNPSTPLNSACWVIDPIDGTTNFASKIFPFAISVAHFNGNFIDTGVCYLPVTDELFYAQAGSGSFLNGKKIKVNDVSSLMECVAATGFADITHGLNKNTLEVFNSVIKKTRALRRLGSAVVDLVYTACGKFAFFYEAGLHPWDVAAGSLIVKEAGGVVTDFNGGEKYITGKTIIASNRPMYNFIKNEIDELYN